jgi:DNA-binding transcriptional LysR family regulator
MDFNHVREFLEIAECGNFLESADNLEIAQSALSKHIQSLEKELGTELFNRTTRKVFLSEGGKTFLPFARQLTEIYQDMQETLKEFIAQERMKLSIGCIPLMANYGIMQILSEFEDRNQRAELNLIEYNLYPKKNISESLLDFEFYLAFCDPATLLTADRFEIIDFCEDHLVALLPIDHHLCTQKVIDLKLLAHERLLLMDETTPIYDLCYPLFNRVGFEPKVHFWGIRVENFVELVSNNMGIAILLKTHLSHVNKKHVAIREISPTAKRTLSFVRALNRHHSSISKKFWSYIKEKRGYPDHQL